MGSTFPRTCLVGILAVSALPSFAQSLAPRSASRVYGLPPLTAPTGGESLYLDAGSNALTGNSMTLSALAAYLAARFQAATLDIALSGSALIPAGPHHVSAAPGSTLTLPFGAPVGTVEEVDDFTGGAGATPISVVAPFDAPILEQSPYPLTVPFEVMGFRKLPSGAWRPF